VWGVRNVQKRRAKRRKAQQEDWCRSHFLGLGALRTSLRENVSLIEYRGGGKTVNALSEKREEVGATESIALALFCCSRL